MIIEVFVFAILSNSAVQAMSLLSLEPTSTEIPCGDRISWYRQITEQTERLYKEYHANLAEASINLENLQTLKEEHVAFENAVSEVFKGPKDDSEKEGDCYAHIDWYQTMNTNLAKISVDIKQELLDVLNRSEVPSSQKNFITDLLTRLMNFLSTVNLPTNQFKVLETLEKQSQMDQKDTPHTPLRVYRSSHHSAHHSSHPSVHHPAHHSEHHSEHHTSGNTWHTSTHNTRHSSTHNTTHPVGYENNKGTAVAVISVILTVIVVVIVAVLCPCKRTPYNQV